MKAIGSGSDLYSVYVFCLVQKNKQQKKNRKPVKIHNEIVGWKIVDSSL